MEQIFPYANVITGVLIILVGFGFHWIGQLVSIVNWEFATRVGLQEKNAPAEYKVYEHGIAVADTAIGWIYGVAAVGLMLGSEWGFKLAFFPGVILIYHSISFWFWTANQRKAGLYIFSTPMRLAWFLANSITGTLAVLVAWNGY